MNPIPQQDRLKTKASPVVARRFAGPDTRFFITAGIAGGLGVIAIAAIVLLFHRLPERAIAPAAPVPQPTPMMVSTGGPVEVIGKPPAAIAAPVVIPATIRTKRTSAAAFRGRVSPRQEEVQSAKAEALEQAVEKSDAATAGDVKEADQKAEAGPGPKEAAAEEPAEIRQAGKLKRALGSLLHPFQRRKAAVEQ